MPACLQYAKQTAICGQPASGIDIWDRRHLATHWTLGEGFFEPSEKVCKAVPHELSTAASRNQRERVYGRIWLPACGVRLAKKLSIARQTQIYQAHPQKQIWPYLYKMLQCFYILLKRSNNHVN